MSNNKNNLLQAMRELKENVLNDIKKNLISDRLYENMNTTKEDMELIKSDVDEILENNVDVNIKVLGNPEENNVFYEVMINNDVFMKYEYYNNELEKVAEQTYTEDIELVGKYRDIPSILEQIEALRGRDDLSLEELEKIIQVAEENGIEIDELYEIDLEQEIKNKDDKNNSKEDEKDNSEEFTQTKAEEISRYAKQEIDTEQLIDGRETLASRLGLQDYSKIYVVYSDKVDEVKNEDGTKNNVNNTRFSLIGVRKDGTAKVLSNSEFKIDEHSGINPNDKTLRFKDDKTVQKANDVLTRYRRAGSNEYLSISQDDNFMGQIRVSFEAGRTRGKNETVGIEVETNQTKRPYEGGIDVKTRRIMSREHGINNLDNLQDEAESELKTDEDGKLEPEQADEKMSEEQVEAYRNEIMNELLKDDDIIAMVENDDIRIGDLKKEVELKTPDIDSIKKEDKENLKRKVKDCMKDIAQINECNNSQN